LKIKEESKLKIPLKLEIETKTKSHFGGRKMGIKLELIY
jgi:hypothetical protein